MALNQLFEELERIKQIAIRWSDRPEIPDIERELVLDKLRALYEQVMFLQRERMEDLPCEAFAESAPSNDPPVGEDRAPAVGKMPEAHVDPAPHSTPEFTPKSTAPSATLTSSRLTSPSEYPVEVPEPGVPTPEEVPQEWPEEFPLESPAATPEEFPVESPATAPEESPSEWPTQNPDDEPDATAPRMEERAPLESVEQKLFCDEPMVRQRVDKQVILSLYGDNAHAAIAPKDTHSPQPTHETTGQSRSEVREYNTDRTPQPRAEVHNYSTPTPTQAQNYHTNRAPQPPQMVRSVGEPENGAPKRVWGEVMPSNGTPINEVLGKQQAHQDVASRLRSNTLSNLRQGIGINERFLLLRELFGGDAAQYDLAIDRLNEFNDLDEAMIYIQEHFHWNPDSKATTLLVELLERKLEA